MSKVEDRILSLKFDNDQFESAVRITLTTLGKLKEGLAFKSSRGGIDDVTDAVGTQDDALGMLAAALDNTQQKFSLLGAIGFTAVQRVTNGVIDLGKKVVGGALGGGLDRAMKIEQAQFKFRGLGQDVEASMESALYAVKGTAYGLDAAASVASQFGAAGMEAGDEMSGALRGVSGMASMAGTSFEEIGQIFTTVAGAGKLTTMRLQQFETRGVNAAAALAEQMGVTEAEVRKMVTNGEIDFQTFANAMNDAFGEHATKANETYTGSLSNMNAALSRVGAMFHAPRLTAMRDIFNALTDVVDNVADSLGPLVERWTEFLEVNSAGFVDFLEGLDLTKLIDVIDPLSEGIFNILNAIISLLGPIKQAFSEVFEIGPIINMVTAFRDFTKGLQMGSETADKLRRTFKGVFAIFSIAGQIIGGVLNVLFSLVGALFGSSGGFLGLTATIGDWLVWVDKALKDGNLLNGIFSALGTVLSLPIKLFGVLGGVLGNIAGGFTNIAASAGTAWDILVRGNNLEELSESGSLVVRALVKMREAFEFVTGAASQFFNIVFKGDFVGGPWLEEDSPITDFLMGIGEQLRSFFSIGNITALLGGGAIATVAMALRNVFKGGFEGLFGGGNGGILDTIKGAFTSISGAFDGIAGLFDTLTGALKTMQQDIKANIILKIAIAVGILAVSLKLLSTIDAGALGLALGAMTVAFTELIGALAVLTKIAGVKGAASLPAIALALILLSVAVAILAVAIKSLAELSWEELAKGLVGVAGALALLIAAAFGLSKVQGPLMRTALAMIPLAIGIRILVGAVKGLAEMSWEELGRGMAGLAGMILVLSGAMRLMPKGMAGIGVGLALVGVGVAIIAASVSKMAGLSWEELGRGMVGLAGALLIIAGALRLMPANMAMMGVGLAVVAIAIQGLTAAIISMGGMSWEELAKGLVGLAGALAILAVALMVMNGTVVGSGALILAAIAIGLLVPPLMMLGMLSWGEILKGLVALAGALTVLGVAGLLLTFVIPSFILVGVAMLAFGAGLLAAGKGMVLFAAGLVALSAAMGAGQAALVNLMGLLPQLAVALAEGIAEFAVTIAANAQKFVGAFTKLLLALLDAIIDILPKIGEVIIVLIDTIVEIIIESAPRIGEAVTALIDMFLSVVVENAPKIIDAIFTLMMEFLTTIRDRIPEIITVATDIIIAFVRGIGESADRVTQAAFDTIITFVESLTNTINNNMERMRTAGRGLAFAIADGMTLGLLSKVRDVANAAADLGRKAIQAAKSAIRSDSPSKEFILIGEDAGDGFVIGLEDSARVVGNAAYYMGTEALEGTRQGLAGIEELFSDISSAGNQAWNIITRRDFVGGVWDEDSPIVDGLFNMRDGFTYLGRAAEETVSILAHGDFLGGVWDEDSDIVDGLFKVREGFEEVGVTAESVRNILTDGDYTGGIFEEDSPIVNGLFEIRDAFGPKAVEEFQTLGDNIVAGLIAGVEDGTNLFHAAIAEMSNGAIDTAKDVLDIHSPSREFEKIGENSADGLVKGVDNKSGEVKKAGANLATSLVMGFTTGAGKEMPKALDSVLKTLEEGTNDARFWGPHSQATVELMGMRHALVEVNLQMAEFYGEVDRSNPESLEAYAEKAGDSLTYLAGTFEAVRDTASKAFSMMAEGAGLDEVVASTEILSGILAVGLSLLPGVEGAAIGIGLVIIDAILAVFMGPGTTVLGIIGDFLGDAVRWIGGLFGIEFPSMADDIEEAEEAVEDFLVTVEGGHGRFQKLTEAGVAALVDTLSNVDDLLKMDEDPTITPVLDLSEFDKDHAKMMAALDPPVDIAVNTSNAQATGVYNMQRDLGTPQVEEEAAPVTNIEYNQYNNSPKALSHVEIYRQTKGQLSLTKEELKVT